MMQSSYACARRIILLHSGLRSEAAFTRAASFCVPCWIVVGKYPPRSRHARRWLADDSIAPFSTCDQPIRITRNREAQEWKKTLEHWDKIPVGSMTTADWNQADAALLWWTRGRNEEGVKNAWKLLDRLVQEKEIRNKSKSATPCKRLHSNMLHLVLLAWQRCVVHNGFPQVTLEYVLERLDRYYPHLMPDSKAYGMIANAVIKSHDKAEAPTRMDGILKRIENDATVQLNSFHCNCAMLAWANSGDPSAGEKAEAILTRMLEQYQAGNRLLKPTNHNVTSVILAWAGDAQRAEAVLRRMLKTDLEPNEVVMTAVIKAWSKSRDPNAAQRAEMILQQMQEWYQAGNLKMQPTAISFNTVISAWARSKDPSAIERAEALVRQMQELYEAGNRRVKPNLTIFQTLLFAFVNSKDPTGLERAESWLGWMLDTLEPGLVVDGWMFLQIMDAWAKKASDDPSAAQRADSLLRVMIKLHEVGQTNLEPTTLFFSCVIEAWARSKDPSAGKNAEWWLEYMKKLCAAGNKGCIPDTACYRATMAAWRNSSDPDAILKMNELVNEMYELVMENECDNMSDAAYGDTLEAIASSQLPDKAERAWQVLKEMKQPGTFHFNEVLRLCVLTRGERNHQLKAFLIAMEAFETIHKHNGVQPDALTYLRFFEACEGKGRGRKKEVQIKAIEAGYKLCCENGFSEDNRIISQLDRLSSQLLR